MQGGKFSLAAGGGPYLFFNTVTRRSTEGYGDTHGIGVAASVDASMEMTKRWLLHLRSNWMGTPGDDTISALGGVSYRFDPPAASSLSEGEYGSEITLMAGLTILNSLSSEHSNDVALEYRRHLFRYLDWTAGWLWEGNPGGLSRNGAVSQVWGVAPLVDDTFSVGIGAGLYAAFEHDENRDDRHVFSALMGLTARYKLSPRWVVRTTWYRVMTDYDRDTDVIVGGVGYAF